MSLLDWVYAVVKIMVLPPGLMAAVGLLGLAALRRRPRLGTGLLAGSVALTWILAMPITSDWAARAIEVYPPVTPEEIRARGAEAILVLGGGAYHNAPEYGGGDNVKLLTLERLRYAARLQRATGLPLVTSGGFAVGFSSSEGQLMRDALVHDFGVPVAGTEEGSMNTADNAAMSRKRFPYRRIALVTHAMHMPRAVRMFEQAGFEVLPAPLGFVATSGRTSLAQSTLADYLPTLQGLVDSHYVIYEAVGALWYRYAH